MANPGSTIPNILFISTHDINPDLNCYAGVWPGAEYAVTPNLDQLAAEGARYDMAFATTPVCAPSRSALITGMLPTTIGTMHMRSNAVPPPEVRCFPEYLREAGYYCTNNFFTDFQFQPPVTVFDECSPTAHWRNRPDPDQPFFAAFHGMVTHESQIYVDEEKYRKNTARLTPEQRHDPALAPVPPYYPNTPPFQTAVARYSDNVTALDYQVGDLLQQLEQDKVADNTLVVFWSDHGRGFPREKRWPYEAGLHVPMLIRWPGKIPAGSVNKDLVYTMDLAATFLEVAGLPVPAHMHSQPLFDREGRPHPHPRQYLIGHRDRMGETEDTVRTVRDARFHYMRNYYPQRPYAQHQNYAETTSTWRELRQAHWLESQYRGAGINKKTLTPAQHNFMATTKPAEELYDLVADPYETINLAADLHYQAELARLRKELDQFESSYPDLGMMPEEELLESWRPGGVFSVTDPPVVSIAGGRLVVDCSTEGASIGWTTEPPGPEPVKKSGGDTAGFINMPDTGGRRWMVYSRPFTPPAGVETVWFRAHRIGFKQSEDVAFELNTEN
jgi:N-sulfoglucosamine sulfohydrolase